MYTTFVGFVMKKNVIQFFNIFEKVLHKNLYVTYNQVTIFKVRGCINIRFVDCIVNPSYLEIQPIREISFIIF